MSAVPRTLIRQIGSFAHRHNFVLQQTILTDHVKRMCVSKPWSTTQWAHTKLLNNSEKVPSFNDTEKTSPARCISGTTSLTSTQAAIENFKSVSTESAHESRKSSPLLRRPFGGLEIMYHQAIANGTDIEWVLAKVGTVFPVDAAMFEKALFFLADRHPMLRMSVQCDANDISFQETDHLKIDFTAPKCDDWLQHVSEEVSIPFDISTGPLWRCRLLKVGRIDQQNQKEVASDEFMYESTVLFVSHHSAKDGRYLSSIVGQFVNILNDIDLDKLSTNTLQALPLFPPVEDLLVCPPFTRTSEKSAASSSPSSSISANFSDPPTQAIDDYNIKFRREIQDVWSDQPCNRYLIHEFTRKETAKLLRSCKDMGLSSTGVLVAASLQAFADLVYSPSSQRRICIPFEFVLDLRRFCPKDILESAKPCLPGVASTTIPMFADLELSRGPKSNDEIWEMSKSFGHAINNEINSQEAFKQALNIINDSKNLNKLEHTKGKSPYVLCISNMGCLDGLNASIVTKRVMIREIHGHSSILVDDCPIFYMCYYSLNGKLYVNISFCENYTSVKTTEKYMDYIKEYILTPSTKKPNP